MYSYHHQRLDSPPPPSQFRRPWSPLELDPHDINAVQGLQRQPSEGDASLEVLDLAEYSRSLPNRTSIGPNSHAWSGAYYPEYPSTPPRSFSLASRASLSTSPPSLTSLPSSASRSQVSRLYTPPPSHRTFSLPPPRISRPSPPGSSSPSSSRGHPRLVESQVASEQNERADVSSFPEWSRNWYANNVTPKTRFDSYAPVSNFDPAAVLSYDSYTGFNSAHPYSSTDESHRDLLPWSLDDESSGRRVTQETKEERMRMLEREFGRGTNQGQWYRGSSVIGSVDAKGNIVSPGPKKRVIVRWMQGTCAFGASITSLYSALILKPDGNPPPRGTIPAYLLYILSVTTSIFLVYFFAIRPFCCSGKRSRKESQEGPGGMMVLPVQQLPGAPGKKKKRGKKGKNDVGGGVSVNLIVDPTMFSGRDRREGEKSDDDESESFARAGRRRGIFEGLAMEEQWKEARRRLKNTLFFDIALSLLWGAVFVVILLGKRCPIGDFEGWCDGYNVATALSAFLCVSFGTSVFFDVKDLHLSKVSPRTRT